MGRDALSLAAGVLGLRADDTVLLPAYACDTVSTPFLRRCHVEFYDVRGDLAVDPSVIRTRLEESGARMALLINYFGFLQPYRHEIRTLCEEKSVTLIEDCAHSLLTKGSGETGDLAIHSFRKILPLADGGGLKINTNGASPAPNFYPRVYSDCLSLLSIAKGYFKVRTEALNRANLAAGLQKPVSRNTLTAPKHRVLQLSSFARNGIGNTCLPDVYERRRDDYRFWQEWIQNTKLLTPVFADIPAGVCPLGFPVKSPQRDLLRAKLQKVGVFLKIYWRLPTSVGREFVNSHEIASEVFTLPIYPELGSLGREQIVHLLSS